MFNIVYKLVASTGFLLITQEKSDMIQIVIHTLVPVETVVRLCYAQAVDKIVHKLLFPVTFIFLLNQIGVLRYTLTCLILLFLRLTFTYFFPGGILNV